MKVIFKGYYLQDTLQSVLTIGGFTIGDELDINYDELDGKKRIIITRYEDEQNNRICTEFP